MTRLKYCKNVLKIAKPKPMKYTAFITKFSYYCHCIFTAEMYRWTSR